MAVAAICLPLTACATGGLRLPAGQGAPLTDPAGISREALSHCEKLHAVSAELAISGRVGADRLRGRLVAGFAEPDRLRLEAVAPFGAPVFILVSDAGAATLLLPRESAVLTGAAPAQVLEALTGVSLSPADLRAALAGCVTSAPLASGVTFPDGWAALQFTDGSAGWFRKVGTRWALRVATRAGWRVEYPVWTGRFPAAVRLTAGDTDLRLEVRQMEANVTLDPGVFAVAVPPSAEAIGLEEIRRAGRLKERR